jgi:hypothetical protein
MNITTKENEALVEQLAGLLAEQVQEWAKDESAPGIGEIEQGMRQLLQEVGQRALGKSISAADERYRREAPCGCGGVAAYVARRPAKVLSVFGWVEYRRSYYLCQACGRGQSPLDGQLGLRPGRVSAGLHPLLALLGIQTSFEEARKTVKRLLLLDVSDNTIRKETQRVGQRRAAQEAVWQAQSKEPTYLDDRRRKQRPPRRLYGSIDGVSVRVGEEWRELRVGCWYEVAPISERQWPSRYKQRIGQLEGLTAEKISYYCDIGEWPLLADLAWATGCQRQADIAQELVFVADGAKWIWDLVDLCFPKAVQIVDWYHAIEYLTPIATALYADELEAQAWRQRMTTKLWESDVEEVIAVCQALQDHPQAGEAANKAATYYQNNKHRMDYDHYREEGYLIGSGTVESGCKQIATMRLKRSGARWTKEGAVATAKARAAWLSSEEEWDSVTRDLSHLPLAS